MKIVFKTTFLLFMLAVVACQSSTAPQKETKAAQVLEASCGVCQFGMKGDDCELAVRLDGKPYFVDSTSIDDHGDAHDKAGFCNAIRKAEVEGQLVNGRFKVAKFKLLP